MPTKKKATPKAKAKKTPTPTPTPDTRPVCADCGEPYTPPPADFYSAKLTASESHGASFITLEVQCAFEQSKAIILELAKWSQSKGGPDHKSILMRDEHGIGADIPDTINEATFKEVAKTARAGAN